MMLVAGGHHALPVAAAAISVFLQSRFATDVTLALVHGVKPNTNQQTLSRLKSHYHAPD